MNKKKKWSDKLDSRMATQHSGFYLFFSETKYCTTHVFTYKIFADFTFVP